MLYNEIKNESIQKLNDEQRTIFMVTKQIKHFVKRFSDVRNIRINCWVNGGHYTRFKCDETLTKFSWLVDLNEKFKCDEITLETENITDLDFNKLLVTTFRTMCASLDEQKDVLSSPEDILEYAEQKLKELISEETSEVCEFEEHCC